MRYLAALVTVLLWAAAVPCALAQSAGQPAAMVPLLPLPATPTPDIDAVLAHHWAAYYHAPGELGFERAQVRVGRIDLDEDGVAELLLLLDAPAWAGDGGAPLLVARWAEGGWTAVGWAYADADGVWVTTERLGGWATIETPSQMLRWGGKAYVTTNRDGG